MMDVYAFINRLNNIVIIRWFKFIFNYIIIYFIKKSDINILKEVYN